MQYTATNYHAALLALLPAGSAWPREPDSELSKLLKALAQEFARIDARANQLLAESLPSQTVELLAEWETDYALPDGCSTAAQTIEERRAALQQKYLQYGSQSREFLTELAAAMGISITITEYQHRRFGDNFGEVWRGQGWNFVVQVDATATEEQAALAAYLECALKRVLQAHKVLIYTVHDPSSLLAYYPLTANLTDTKGGAEATFERASRKLVHNTVLNRMQWLAEDVPALSDSGIWLEMQASARFPYSENLSSGWSGGEYGSSITQVSDTDPMGIVRNVAEITDTNSVLTAVREQGANGTFKMGAFVKRTSAFSTSNELQGFYVYSAANRKHIRMNFVTSEPETADGGSLSFTWDLASFEYQELSDDWVLMQAELNRPSSTALSWGITCWPVVSNSYRIGGVWLQDDLDGSIILSTSAAATRAADQLITHFDSSGDDYCMYAKVQFSRRWDLFTTPKFSIFADAADSAAQFGGAVFRYTEGQAFLRVYHGTDGYFGIATGYAFDVLADYPLHLILRVRKVSATHSQCRIDFRIGSDPWVEGSWTGNILTAELTYSALQWGAEIGVIQADGYTSVTQSRRVLGVKKIAGVDHTPAAIEAMTT